MSALLASMIGSAATGVASSVRTSSSTSSTSAPTTGLTPSGAPKGTAAALQLVKCKLSAALLPGNLIANSKYFAYIHRNEVQLIDQKLVALGNEKADTIKVGYSDKDYINQLEFLKIAGIGDVLVVLNQAGGIFIYDESGQKLVHSYKYSKSGGAATLKDQHLRGIAYDGKETLYVGSGSGDLLVFQLNKSKFTLTKTFSDVHVETSSTGGGISALVYSSRDNVLVSGDDFGNIVFWSGSGSDLSPSKTVRLEGKGSPVNLLAVGHDRVVAAFASGHLRIYDPSKKQLICEIAAHTRAINGLDIHPTKPIVMASSEDTFVSVWTLPSSSGVKHLMSESPVLGLLTGGRFGGANHELIVTTTYDNRSLALMHTP